MFTMLTILLVESDVQWIFGANADTNNGEIHADVNISPKTVYPFFAMIPQIQ